MEVDNLKSDQNTEVNAVKHRDGMKDSDERTDRNE